MLENPRFNESLPVSAKNEWHNPHYRQILLEQQFLTQRALEALGANRVTPPTSVAKVDRTFMVPERVMNLRTPYAVEVLGMPGAGKTTMINRYLEELWLKDKRHKVALIREDTRDVKNKYGDLRYSDPFLYSQLVGTANFIEYFNILKNTANSGMKMIISDRGQIDRRIFRRVFFSQGYVNPEIMAAEDEFTYGMENTLVQICGIIIFMVRPKVTMERIKKSGPVVNMNFLPRMYEQLWRLHYEILQDEVPYRIYTCIDAEKDSEKVYERFKYAMDTTLNVHNLCLAALAKAFPKEFDTAKTAYDKTPRRQSHAQRVLGEKLGGKKVLIVGGDDMVSEEDILQKPIIEGLRLKK